MSIDQDRQSAKREAEDMEARATCQSDWTAGGAGACDNPVETTHQGLPCCWECKNDDDPMDDWNYVGSPMHY